MWWWQSVAFGGAFVFAGAVPVDHGTCCACACEMAMPVADAPIIAKMVLRFQSRPAIVASLVVSFLDAEDCNNAALLRSNPQDADGRSRRHIFNSVRCLRPES